jgi:F-type H+-transporting ATPase subunit b
MNILAMILQENGGESFSLFSLNTGVVIWTLVIFIALVLILGRFAWRPILGALEARERHIQDVLDAAARDRIEAEKALAEHRRQLAEGRQQAQQIVVEGKQAAERVRQEMLDTARRQQDDLLARARDDIRHEREQAIDLIRREAVDLSLAAASHLVEKRLDTAEDRRLVQRYLAELEQEGTGPAAGGDGAPGRGGR